MGLKEIISGSTNADGDYDDVYLPKKAGLFGSPAADPVLAKLAGPALVLFAGAFAFRLWRAKGPGKRRLRKERESA